MRPGYEDPRTSFRLLTRAVLGKKLPTPLRRGRPQRCTRRSDPAALAVRIRQRGTAGRRFTSLSCLGDRLLDIGVRAAVSVGPRTGRPRALGRGSSRLQPARRRETTPSCAGQRRSFRLCRTRSRWHYGVVAVADRVRTDPAVQLALRRCVLDGIAQVEWADDDPLARLAKALAVPVLDQRVLIPHPESHARRGTLSARHGLGTFPWHTDGAHWLSPPRLILMRALTRTSTPTLFVDVAEITRDSCLVDGLRHGSWCVTGRTPHFYAPVLAHDGAVRFNAEVMRPVGQRAILAHSEFTVALRSVPHTKHQWSPGCVLLVDNGRLLHARPPVPEPDSDRRLERTLCGFPNRLGSRRASDEGSALLRARL